MKRIYIIMYLLVFHFSLNGQSKQDTKDFIIEKVNANSPLENYHTYVFFQNIFEKDADKLAGKELSKEELNNIFIYAIDMFSDKNNSESTAEVIDIRDITKVSTTRIVEKINYYVITIYVGNKYYSKKYNHSPITGTEYKYLNKMDILISDSEETALKIKKAIIYLAKLHGVNAKDGDYF